MQGLAFLHGLGAFTPAEEGAGVVVQVRGACIQFRSLGTAKGGEQVAPVPFPAAREVDTLGAVVRGAVLALQEHHFVPVIELRDAAEGGQEGQAQFHLPRIGPPGVAAAGMVMVGKEDEHVREILIHEVLRQHRVDARHALVPVHFFLAQGRMDGVFQREVHDGRQVGIEAVLVGIVLLPVGHLRDVVVPALPYDVHVGILVRNGLAPLGHGLRLVVRIGIHPKAIQAGVLCPPNGPLLEILEDEGVIQVHIRHGRHKPAAFLAVAVHLGGVGVHVHGEQGVHLHVRIVHMVPVLERGVLHPPVRRAAVVGDNVHNHLEAFLVRLGHKGLVVLVVAKSRVDMIIVGAGIAVVALARLVVQQERGAPDSRSAQIGNIIQVVDEALDVAAVTGHRVLPVHLVRRSGNTPGAGGTVQVFPALPGLVIVLEGRCKAVRHNQVNHIGRGVALAVCASFFPLTDDVRVFEGLSVLGEHQVVGIRRGLSGYFHIHKEEVGAVGLVNLFYLEPVAGDGHFIRGNVRSLDQELKFRFHARPPAQGLHTGNLRCRFFHIGGIQRLRSRAGGEKGDSSHQNSLFHLFDFG